MTGTELVAGSFRDPSGFLFVRDGVLYRQVNAAYRRDYDLLMGSGLYQELVDRELLIPHREEPAAEPAAGDCYKILAPEMLPFVSYPYEWCFSQLQDAALTTLRIQSVALEHGMSLKDASAYNVQFRRGKPIFIDTLSFEAYQEGRPWVAYRQFCRHFLAPLALVSLTDHRLGQLFRVFLDGVPLDLASRSLPHRSRLSLSLLTHLHLHARAENRMGERAAAGAGSRAKVSRRGLDGILASLESGVKRLAWKASGTVWADYYSDTNYSETAWRDKQRRVAELLGERRHRMVWDLGANTGEFSRIAAEKADLTVAFDLDPAAVERNYLQCKDTRETRLLPLVQDLTNPSPGIGWANTERLALTERGRPDLVLALALIHHLAIGNNLPLEKIAAFLRQACSKVILEFVPKSDSQVRRMLATRKDIFTDYSREGLEAALAEHFTIEKRVRLEDSERSLYLLEGR